MKVVVRKVNTELKNCLPFAFVSHVTRRACCANVIVAGCISIIDHMQHAIRAEIVPRVCQRACAQFADSCRIFQTGVSVMTSDAMFATMSSGIVLTLLRKTLQTLNVFKKVNFPTTTITRQLPLNESHFVECSLQTQASHLPLNNSLLTLRYPPTQLCN